jgi:hypothetical protein
VAPYLVPFIHQLVRSRNQLQPVHVVELGSHFVPKEPSGTTWTDGPSFHVFGVAPDEIAKGALVGYLLGSSDDADLVNRANLRTEPAVHAKDLAVDDGSQY